MKIAQNVLELVGQTPLVELGRFAGQRGLRCRLAAKLESREPAGSVKDRVGVALLRDAQARGALKPGGTVIEPTSGNTGIGLAMACAVEGYRLILTMPETMSVERRKLLAAYGAELVLTEGARGMTGAVEKASELAAAQGAAAMWTLVLACPFMALARFCCSYFCAAGEPVAGAVIAFGEPLAAQPLFLFTLPLVWGLEGVWIAYPAAVMLTAAAALVLMRRHLALLPRQDG